MADTTDDDTRDPLALLDELQGIADNGLESAEDPHDRRRYERLRDLTEAYYG